MCTAPTAMEHAKFDDRSTRPASSGNAETLTPCSKSASVTLKSGVSNEFSATLLAVKAANATTERSFMLSRSEFALDQSPRNPFLVLQRLFASCRGSEAWDLSVIRPSGGYEDSSQVDGYGRTPTQISMDLANPGELRLHTCESCKVGWPWQRVNINESLEWMCWASTRLRVDLT